MRRIVAALSSVAMMFVFVAAAAPADRAQGTQIKDGFLLCYGEGAPEVPGCGDHTERTPSKNGAFTLGNAISSGFFGNTANPRPDGNGVQPPQSPGPFSNVTGEMYECHLGDVISNSVRGTGDPCDANPES